MAELAALSAAGIPSLPARRAGGPPVRALSLAALLALWWLGAVLAASPQLFPGPVAVLAAAWRETLAGDLPRNVAITLARVLAAFALSMLVGVALGFAMGRSRKLDAALDPWLVVALNLPVLVVVVLVYIWVGLNDVAAILAVAIAKVPTVVVTVREGARALDRGLDEVAFVFGVPPLRRLRRVVVAQLAPYLAAAGRSGLSITWKIVLIVELLGRPDGVGFALNLAFQAFDVAAILAYGLVFAAIMLLIEAAALRPLERRAGAWRGA